MNKIFSTLLPYLRLNTGDRKLEVITEYGVKARIPLTNEEYEEAKKVVKNIF